MKRITEKEIILPALFIISQNSGITTTRLIRELELLLKPEGEDAEISNSRGDSKFSQIVRNLKSHRPTNGMEVWTHYSGGKYAISKVGLERVRENQILLDALADGYAYADTVELIHQSERVGKKLLVYPENISVHEGARSKSHATVLVRSKILRDYAIQQYTVDGDIRCQACGFSFLETYGELGKLFIEMHHEEPLYQLAGESVEVLFADVKRKLKPVCANCHRMLHRSRTRHMTVERLRDILHDALNNS